jgi:hypothetical protein
MCIRTAFGRVPGERARHRLGHPIDLASYASPVAGPERHPEIDRSALAAVVRQVLHLPSAELADWHAEPLAGLGFVGTVHRITGAVQSPGAGPERTWSVVRKHVADTGSTETDLRYWRREPLAYASGLLEGIAGANAPRCFAQSSDPTGVALWLEDVSTDEAPWDGPAWERAADALARLAAPYALGAPLPDHAWLSRGWLEGWVEQSAPALGRFDEAVGDPWVAPLYPPPVATITNRLWADRQRLLQCLRESPPVLGHLDAVPANIVRSRDAVTLLDWAFVGHAALGEDLASLVGSSVLFGGASPDELPDVDALAFNAYVGALRDAGWAGPASQVRAAYCTAAALRYLLGPVAILLGGLDAEGRVVEVGGVRDPDQRAFFERSFGRPIGELLEVIGGINAFLAQLGAEALERATGTGPRGSTRRPPPGDGGPEPPARGGTPDRSRA